MALRIGFLRVHIEKERIAHQHLRAVFADILGRDERQKTRRNGIRVIKILVARRRKRIMFASVDDPRPRRQNIEHAVVEVMQKISAILGAVYGIGQLHIADVSAIASEEPEREKRHVGIFPEDARKNLAPALPRQLYRFGERRILGRMAVLMSDGVFLGIEHQALHAALLREPRDARHVLGEIRPRLVVRPVEARIVILGRHPEKKEAFA